MFQPSKKLLLVLVGILAFPLFLAEATDYSSSNYIIKDPVVDIGGGYSTSSNYQMLGSLGQEAIGTSTASSFDLFSGFLYFLSAPTPPSGLAAAATSQTQINLSWTDNSNNESGFRIERKQGSGGTYAEIATTGANISSYPDSGLSAGTAYYYRVRAYNLAGSSIYSSETSATTLAPVTPPVTPSGGGGGGGGGSYYPITGGNTVIFSGKAYPLSDVTLIKDAQVVASTKAGPDANFQITLSGISAGTYSFGVWAEDSKGLRSITYTFSIAVSSGATTNVSGIFLPPTISTDKTEVKKGDVINILGQSAPQAQISVFINSEQELMKKTSADSSGLWLYKLDSDELDYGDHSARSRSSLLGDISVYSQLAFFKVGSQNVAAAALIKCPSRGDLNNDCKVNLVDFSVAAYWFNRPLTQAISDKEKKYLNGDNKINLVDFSIMAYYWTG